MDQSVRIIDPESEDVAVRDLHFSLIEALYVEAMVLADEARAYFETAHSATQKIPSSSETTEIPPLLRVGFACESLKTTTRLMQIISWLLYQRAIHAGEVGRDIAGAKASQLGEAIPSDPEICRHLPDSARLIITTSEQLYDRVLRLHQNRQRPRTAPPASPVRAMLSQLEHAF